MLSSLLEKFRDTPPLAPAPKSPGQKSLEGFDVGDVIYSYVPQLGNNRPGIELQAGVVMDITMRKTDDMPVLLVSPLKAYKEGRDTLTPREAAISHKDSVKESGLNGPAKLDAWDVRAVPLEIAYFSAGSQSGPVGRLDDVTFERVKDARQVAQNLQLQRDRTRFEQDRLNKGLPFIPPADPKVMKRQNEER